jgi:hypothetical protein
MKSKIHLLLVLPFLISGFLFTSCKKEDESDVMIAFVETDDEIAGFFDEVYTEVDEVSLKDYAMKNVTVLTEGQSGTRIVETNISGDTLIHVVTFNDFINGNLTNERVKNGKITINVLGRPLQTTFWRKVNFNGFSVNGHQLEGVKIIEKTGQHVYSVSLSGGKVSFTDGKTHIREFSRTRTMNAGFGTPFFIWDDEYEIEGTTAGINRKGKSYQHTISEPLVIKMNCRWITQGVIDFSVEDQTATLDYGNGECDRIATLTFNDENYTIKLKGGKN